MLPGFLQTLMFGVADSRLAVSFVGANSGSTSATVASHQVGDLIIGAAYRADATTATIPVDFSTIVSSGANSSSLAIGWKIADGTETSGTWTSADRMWILVFRGSHQTAPIGNTAGPSTAGDGLVDYAALTLTTGEGNLSTFVFFTGINNHETQIPGPTGWTDATSDNNVAGVSIGYAYDDQRTESFAGESNIDSTSGARWRTYGFEILAA
jgi:hypothetical protein